MLRVLLLRAGLVWLPIAVAVTGLATLVYGAVQQDLRQNANDPQIALAENAAAQLNAGASPAGVATGSTAGAAAGGGGGTVELSASLAPYVLVFDRDRHLVASGAVLHGQPPPFPTSVFSQVADGGQDRITWQPEPGVRAAVVVQPWTGGYVVAGRSLRLVEAREDQLLLITAGVWLLTLIGTAVAAALAMVGLAFAPWPRAGYYRG